MAALRKVSVQIFFVPATSFLELATTYLTGIAMVQPPCFESPLAVIHKHN